MERGGNYFLLQDSDSLEMGSIPRNPSTQTNPIAPTPTQMLRINCSKCQISLAYPEEAYCVSCHSCKTLTAVKPIATHLCLLCSLNIFYPAGSKSIKCRCGKTYTFPSH